MKVNIGVIEQGEWCQRWMANWRDGGWWNGRQRNDGLNSASRNDGLDWIVIQEDRWPDSQLFSLPPFTDSILFIRPDSALKDVMRVLLLFIYKFGREKQWLNRTKFVVYTLGQPLLLFIVCLFDLLIVIAFELQRTNSMAVLRLLEFQIRR